MTEIFPGLWTALWLGILTSISPCPLATNIAAVSFLSKRITRPTLVLIAGLSYTLGRMIAYAAIGWIVISSLLSVPQVAQFLQRYMTKALGPILIIVGLILLEAIKINLKEVSLSESRQNALAESGARGAFILGFIFALAFCPVSAALFFGSLIPLALNSKTATMLPFIYGVGTGLPVLAFAVGIALGMASLSRWFHKVIKFEMYARKITGIVFIAVGFHYILAYLL